MFLIIFILCAPCLKERSPEDVAGNQSTVTPGNAHQTIIASSTSRCVARAALKPLNLPVSNFV